MEEIAIKVKNDVNTKNTCFISRFNEAHVSAAADATQCVAEVHSNAPLDVPTYMNFLGPYQHKTILLSLNMLDDLIEMNPVTDGLKLAQEIWPATYDSMQGAFRGNYFYQANDFYSGITKALGRLSIPLDRCLSEVEDKFKSLIENMLQNSELELDEIR